jgi:hypothetical protein
MHQNASRAPELACQSCGAAFALRRRWQRFCSAKCRADFHRAAPGSTGLDRRLAELERRIAALEQAMWPVR